MNPFVLTLSDALLDRLVPYSLVWGSDSKLVRISGAVRKLWSLEEDRNLESLDGQIVQTRPFEAVLNPAWFLDLTGVIVHLSHADSPDSKLRGQFIQHNEDWFFVGFPALKRVRDLDSLGLTLSDLPLHDLAGDLLIANEAGEALLHDAQVKTAALVEANRELRAMNETFARFVPQPFLETLGLSSPVEARLGDHVRASRSVMFTDLRQFTTISEMMEADEIFDLINQYLACVVPCIRSRDGFVCNYLGDGIMALFSGATDNAVKAAVEMQSALKKFAVGVERNNVKLRLGIGIHHGELEMGIVGAGGHWDSTVISDAVNTASRVEGLTKTFGAEILITESVRLAMKDPSAIHCRELGRVTVKGKVRRVPVFEVLDSLPAEVFDHRMQTLDDFQAGLVAFVLEQYGDARAFFEKVSAVAPDDLACHYYLSLISTSTSGSHYVQKRLEEPV